MASPMATWARDGKKECLLDTTEVRRSSNTFIVLTGDGNKAVRSISRYPEQTRRSADAPAKVKATPRCERGTSDPVVRFQEPVVDRGGVEVAATRALQRSRTTRRTCRHMATQTDALSVGIDRGTDADVQEESTTVRVVIAYSRPSVVQA